TNNRYVAFSNNPNYFFDPFGLEDCVRVTREKYTICDYVFWGTDNCNETARSDCYIACENCCFKDAAIAGAIFSMPLFPLYNMVLGATKAVKSVYDAFSNPVPDCIRKCRDNFVSQFKGDCQNQVDPGDNNGCPPDVPNCDEIIY
ncbi:MAG TPA: hypothetical protein PK014_14920, partial [Thermoanaerobaculia bacterium]|nr:hypothetical protein [Thermoanaerobaculia bacterium]HXK69673.1 hypothetical protein [Thermoanaerobaculia bacterium]